MAASAAPPDPYAGWLQQLKGPTKQLWAVSGRMTFAQYLQQVRAMQHDQQTHTPTIQQPGELSQHAGACAAQSCMSRLEAGMLGVTAPSVQRGPEAELSAFDSIRGIMAPAAADVSRIERSLAPATTFHLDKFIRGKQLEVHDSHTASVRVEPWILTAGGNFQPHPTIQVPTAHSRGVVITGADLGPDSHFLLGIAEPMRSRALLDSVLLSTATAASPQVSLPASLLSAQQARFSSLATASQYAAAERELSYVLDPASLPPSEDAMQLAAENHAHATYQEAVAALLTVEFSIRQRGSVPPIPPSPPRTSKLSQLMRDIIRRQPAWALMPSR